MARQKKNKEKFGDEAINSYLRTSIDADKVKEQMSEFKNSLDKSSDEEE